MENEELVNEYVAHLGKSVSDLTMENILLKSKQSLSGKNINRLSEQVQTQAQEIQGLREATTNSSETVEGFSVPNTDQLADETAAVNSTDTPEYLELKRQNDEAEDYIKRLEEGLEQANAIIASTEQERDDLSAKCKTLRSQLKENNGKANVNEVTHVKEITKESEEYKALFTENTKLKFQVKGFESTVKRLEDTVSKAGQNVKTTESKEYQALYKQNVQLLKTVDFNERKITDLKSKLQVYLKEAAVVNHSLNN
jgi:predicted RNase H-like nuclease (RuvC/YqgF family)